MLAVISPAKTLDFESPVRVSDYTRPEFLKDSRRLIDRLRDLTPEDLSELMKISPALGELNYRRFANWHTPFTTDNARQALFAFRGDVYTGLDADSLGPEEIDYAQTHLRILSGLYGLLRPLDLIQPYRLEMGTKLELADGCRNLYQFWGRSLTRKLGKEIAESGSPVLVNLASEEYFKAVDPDELDAQVVAPVFRDFKNGRYKIISFYAKKARGQMSAWILRHRPEQAADLKEFAEAGYRFSAEDSTPARPTFIRDEVPS